MAEPQANQYSVVLKAKCCYADNLRSNPAQSLGSKPIGGNILNCCPTVVENMTMGVFQGVYILFTFGSRNM